MKISNMRYIIEVSKWKSINKASQTLYLNQQQLSRMISAVENDLGVEIFHRSTKGVFLTEQGEQVVKKFEQIVELYDSITSDQQSEETIHGNIILAQILVVECYNKSRVNPRGKMIK